MANETIICSKCGSENLANRLHCAACGARLEADIADDIKTPLKPFSVITKKGAALFLVIIIGLFISNELFFRWAKQYGVSENEIYDFSSLNLDQPYGSGKSVSIIAIAFDSLDNLWIAGSEFTSSPVNKRSNFVTRLSSDGISKTYEIGEGDQYLSLAIDSHDQVWIGGGFGLRKLTQQGRWSSVSDQIIDGMRVGSLAADNQGQLWVTTEGQLSRLSDGKWTHFPEGFGRIAVDPQGRVWTMHSGKIGFFSLDDGWEIVFTPPYSEIYNFAIDKNGRIWAQVRDSSSYHGLAVCDENTWKCTVYHANISAAFTRGTMAFDNHNRLWIKHMTGIRVIDVDRALSVGILTGLLIFRLVLSILLFLTAYFVIVQLSDSRKEKTIQEYLTPRDVLKRVWLPLVLVGLVGPVLLAFTGAFYIYKDSHILVLFIITVIIGALVTLIRARSLMVNHHISKEDVVYSIFYGGLITFICTIPIRIILLFLTSLGQ